MKSKDKDDDSSHDYFSKDNYEKQHICFLSTYPPRECGIATFCRDLAYAIKKKFNPKIDINIAAINEDPTAMYNYSSKVKHKISQSDIEDYIELAKKLNQTKSVKVVNIQHEFGLFGGEYGNNIIPFLETIEKPVVVTFHSVIEDPDDYQKKVVKSIIDRSDAGVVMAKKAVDILVKDYDADKKKIHFVPHGTPQIPYSDPDAEKKKLGFKDKIILSTFGLLNRGKGIEYIIKSLPKVVEKYPNVLYLIIGETHPQIRRKEGEKYRNKLKELIDELGLKDNVKFYNKYLTLKEIISYLKATDIYISPGLDEKQIVSGTLAYAFAAGRPIVSTRFPHAKEILSDGAGITVKFKSPKAYEKAILKLLDNPELRKEMAQRAYLLSRNSIWPNVAQSYMKIYEKLTELRKEEKKFPKINLKHLIHMTDDRGIFQFAIHSTPDEDSGYTTDDNARALIVAAKHYALFKSKISKKLANTYINFLERMQKNNGNFFNYLGKELQIMDRGEHEDAYGRALWALGKAIYYFKGELRERAKKIFDNALNFLDSIEPARSKAFSILGLYYYDQVYPSLQIKGRIKKLADSLIEAYNHNSKEDWSWFEPKLTYANSVLPEALYLAYAALGNQEYLEIADESFNFLCGVTFIEGKLVPVGQNGWFSRNGKRSFYDQQPIETSYTVRACLVAYEVTNDKKHLKNAVTAFNWFLGKNSLNQMVYDESTGGSYDGLSPDQVNVNQGAESTLSYLMARLALEEKKKGVNLI